MQNVSEHNMLGTWTPDDPSQSLIDSQILIEAAGLVTDLDQLNSNTFDIKPEWISTISNWLKLPESDWQSAVDGLSTEQLKQLTVFFTATEMQINEWQSDSRNPTIYILRLMKSQGTYPEKDFVRGLKSLTKNRYIPYGSAL